MKNSSFNTQACTSGLDVVNGMAVGRITAIAQHQKAQVSK